MRLYFRPLAAMLLAVASSPAVATAAPPRPVRAPSPAATLVPPSVVHNHVPNYPAEALRAHEHAEVELRVLVDVEGHVASVEVVKSGGKPFDEAAIAAMREWTFSPARRGDSFVSAYIRVPFHFAPPENTAPEEATADASIAVEHEGHVAPTPSKDPKQEVRVLGRISDPNRGAGDHEIKVGALAAVPRTDAASLLRLAPGVMLTNQGGSGHPNQVFLRGFDAREGQDIEFSLDGVPINEAANPHGSGLVDTHFIIPELVRRLRVTEGPFAPQQGNYAVAGSANYELGLDAPGLYAQGTTGSFGAQRLLLLWRPRGFGEQTFGGAEIYSSDGFGQNRASSRATAMAGFDTKVGETGSFRLLATSYAAHYAQAGLLREDDVRAGRKGFYDTYDTAQGGDSARHSLAATLTARHGMARLSQSAFLIYRDFDIRQNFTGFQNDTQQTWQSPHTQRGDLLDQHAGAITLGGRGSVRQSFELLRRKHEVELGYFARYDRTDATRQRLRAGSNIPYRTDLNLNSDLTNIGLYGDLNFTPTTWLTLRGGLRADLFHYATQNACAQTTQTSFGGDPLDTECFSSDRQGYRSPNQSASTSASLLQPRATLLVGPFRGFTLSASYGRGARSIDPEYINQDKKTPFADVGAAETGVMYARSVGSTELNVRSTFFQTRVDKDLFFNAAEGRSTLSNGTTRTGWAGSARAIGKWFDLAGSLTLVRATFDDTKLLIPYVPGLVARIDGAVYGDLPFKFEGHSLWASFGTGVSYIGSRPLPYDERSQTIGLVDAGLNVRWRGTTVGLMATNLLDARYRLGEFNYSSDFKSRDYPTQVASRHFNAGEPRAVYLSVGFRLDADGAPEEKQ